MKKLKLVLLVLLVMALTPVGITHAINGDQAAFDDCMANNGTPIDNLGNPGTVDTAIACDPDPAAGGPITGSSAQKTCEQLKLIDQTHDCSKDVPGVLSGIVGSVINILTLAIGAISVVVITIGGLVYVLSGGEPNNIKRAKDIILYALIGLAVSIFAQAIVRFVIGRV